MRQISLFPFVPRGPTETFHRISRVLLCNGLPLLCNGFPLIFLQDRVDVLPARPKSGASLCRDCICRHLPCPISTLPSRHAPSRFPAHREPRPCFIDRLCQTGIYVCPTRRYPTQTDRNVDCFPHIEKSHRAPGSILTISSLLACQADHSPLVTLTIQPSLADNPIVLAHKRRHPIRTSPAVSVSVVELERERSLEADGGRNAAGECPRGREEVDAGGGEDGHFYNYCIER